MKRLLAPSCLLVFALGGCAATAARPDALCGPLLGFVDSVGVDETRSIVFRTSWGGNFLDDPDQEPVISTKRCEHAGYAPAMLACDSLMEHGVVEFSNRNLTRVIACLSPDTRFGDDFQLLDGSVDIGLGTPDRGVNVSMQFHADEKIGGMVLRIEADGY